MSVHYDCLTSTQTAIRRIGLSGITNNSIVVKKLPLERVIQNDSLSYPVILITPGKARKVAGSGDNVNQDYIRPVQVTLIDQDNQERTTAAGLNTHLDYLEDITYQFDNKRLTGASTVWSCDVEASDPVLPTAWLQNFLAAGLTLNFKSREYQSS